MTAGAKTRGYPKRPDLRNIGQNTQQVTAIETRATLRKKMFHSGDKSRNLRSQRKALSINNYQDDNHHGQRSIKLRIL